MRWGNRVHVSPHGGIWVQKGTFAWQGRAYNAELWNGERGRQNIDPAPEMKEKTGEMADAAKM